MHYSIGVEIGSDFADAPECDAKVQSSPRWQHENVGFWSRGEAQLLRWVAWEMRGHWLDIGAHTGWTASNLVIGDAKSVVSIDPMFSDRGFYQRFAENVGFELAAGRIMPWAGLSRDFFKSSILSDFSGVIIDGDHESPNPENDARNCFGRLAERAVVLLHDFRGPGPWAAGEYLEKQGMQYKIYGSVHMVGVFWRGEFAPPPEIAEGKSSDEWIQHYGKPEWAK